jgi:ribonuclease P protein component
VFCPEERAGANSREPGPASPRIGLTVGRAVGNAVTRNRVRRRLRHAARRWLPRLPAGCVLVVIARRPAADATFRELTGWLDACLARLVDFGVGPGVEPGSDRLELARAASTAATSRARAVQRSGQ